MRDEAAIGQILTCPKCSSMVEIVPPLGWQSPGESMSGRPETGAASESLKATPAAASSRPATGQPTPRAGAGRAAKAKPSNQPPVQGKKKVADATEPAPSTARNSAERPDVAKSAAASVAASLVPTPTTAAEVPPSASTDAPPPAEPPQSTSPPEPTAQTGEPGSAWEAAEGGTAGEAAQGGPWVTSPVAVAPAELLWRKWLLLAAAPVVGVVIGVTIWSFLPSSRGPEPPGPVTPVEPEKVPIVEEPPKEKAEPVASRLDPRWLPLETRLLVSLRSSHLAGRKAFDSATPLAGPAWQMMSRLVTAFGLKLETIHRLSWAATELGNWPDPGLVVVELEEGQDAGVFRRVGRPAEILVEGKVGRRLPRGGWPHPFVVVDELTIVTGREELLQELADRSEPALASLPIDRLFKSMSPDADALVLVDLASARSAGWRLPTSLMDVWPAGRHAWHVAWEVPQGLGVSIRTGQTGVSELALVCEGETAAQSVHAALGELIPGAGTALGGQMKSLAQRRESGRIDAPAADQYETLLTGVSAALGAARWEIIDETVWLRVDWGAGVSDLAVAGAGSLPAIRAAWLDAALVADDANHRGLLASLRGHHQAKGSFPAGAGGSSLLAPETRLSWIATVLPFFDQEDWHQELQFGYPWNSPQNRPVTRRRLDSVVNPALGPSNTEAGFPVTHYVGVAGVGPGAGTLEPGHFRAGVFGFNRTTRLDDIPDGASNTIAILGVTKRLGAWAAGGNATVRALTKPPYVNGPDGFGSGQPDGMLVGMADGSVRFVSKDIDPTVFEQLATVAGGENTTVAALESTPIPRPTAPPNLAAPEPKQPAQQPPERPGPAPKSPEPAPGDLAGGPDAKPAAPVAVDVEARLETRILQIGFPGVPLGDAVELVAQLSALPITFDLDAMIELGVTIHDPVTVELSDATLGEVVEAVLAARGLTYVVDRGQILVTSPEKKQSSLRAVSYTVSDLTGPEPDGTAEFAELVTQLVAPDSWRPAGGQGTIESAPGVLKVVQTGAVHAQVLAFCERLRTARGLPLRSRRDPAKFSLDTRLDRAQAKLSRPIEANFRTPTPLVRIVSDLEALSGTSIFIDWAALGAQGIAPAMETTLEADGQSLAEALDGMLRPMGLAYRVVNGDTLEITSRKVVSARLEREFYPLTGLLTEGVTPGSLMGKIQDQVAGATWADAGGPGVLHFDEPSKCLIVLQSQPVQSELEGLLARWRAERAEAAKANR